MAKLPKSIIKKYGITKKAWAVFRSGRSQSSRKARHSSKGGKTSLARRRARRYFSRARRRSGMGLNLRSIGKIIKLGAFVAPAIHEYSTMSGEVPQKLARTLASYGGYNLDGGNFDGALLAKMWTPYIATTLAITGVSKLSGLIRRI